MNEPIQCSQAEMEAAAQTCYAIDQQRYGGMLPNHEIVEMIYMAKRARQMVHARGAHETHGMPPALSPEQRAWNQQIEAKRKAKEKS